MGRWAEPLSLGSPQSLDGGLGTPWDPHLQSPPCCVLSTVLADDVLLVTDDRGADPGHVQWTPTGPLSEQPWSPKAGHHQRDGGSWAARTVPAGPGAAGGARCP